MRNKSPPVGICKFANLRCWRVGCVLVARRLPVGCLAAGLKLFDHGIETGWFWDGDSDFVAADFGH